MYPTTSIRKKRLSGSGILVHMFVNSMTNSFLTHTVPRQPPKSPEGWLPRGNIEVFYSDSACFLGETSKKTGERRRKRFLSPPPGDLGGCLSGRKYVTELMIQNTWPVLTVRISGNLLPSRSSYLLVDHNQVEWCMTDRRVVVCWHGRSPDKRSFCPQDRASRVAWEHSCQSLKNSNQTWLTGLTR